MISCRASVRLRHRSALAPRWLTFGGLDGEAIPALRPIDDAIEAFLGAPSYYACLLLVHPDVSRLERFAQELPSIRGWRRFSIGVELSAALLHEPSEQWSRKAAEFTTTRLRELAPGPVLCTEIDLLFEPALDLDPLALLRQASRVTTLVVAWPGSYDSEVLTYAVPEHAHYRAWIRPDVAVLGIE